MSIDLIGNSLDDHQPDHIWGEAKWAVVHERLVNGGDDRMVRYIRKQPPVISGAGFNGN